MVQAEKDNVKTISEKQVLGALDSLGFADMKKEVDEVVTLLLGNDRVESKEQRSLCVVCCDL